MIKIIKHPSSSANKLSCFQGSVLQGKHSSLFSRVKKRKVL
jgi:hypothetical protein